MRSNQRLMRRVLAGVAAFGAAALVPLAGAAQASAQPIPGPQLNDGYYAPPGCHYTYDTVGLQAPAISLRCDGIPEAAADGPAHAWIKCIDPQGLIHIHVGENIDPSVPSVSTAFCTVGDGARYNGPARFIDLGAVWY